MSASRTAVIGGVAAVILVAAAAYGWLVDGCASSDVPGRYRLEGVNPIALTLRPGGLANVGVGNRDEAAKWEFDPDFGKCLFGGFRRI
jgi:hypothetical protein